jgi:hypothetical protein
MYFMDETHEANFNWLINRYTNKNLDHHTRAGFYLSAIPDLFEVFDHEHFDPNVSPCEQIRNEELANEYNQLNALGKLTGTTLRLVDFSNSIYSGTPVSLVDVFASVIRRDMVEALIQSIKIVSFKEVF